MEETLSPSLGLNTAVIKSVLRRPTVKNLNAKHVIPTVAAVTRMRATGVKRASFSWVSLKVKARFKSSTQKQECLFDWFQGLCELLPLDQEEF